MYGDSLTSVKFIKKLTDEEAARQQKKGGKRDRPKASTSTGKDKRPLRLSGKQNEENEDDSVVNMDTDKEWVPPWKRQNESDSDSEAIVGLVEIERNVFKCVQLIFGDFSDCFFSLYFILLAFGQMFSIYSVYICPNMYVKTNLHVCSGGGNFPHLPVTVNKNVD